MSTEVAGKSTSPTTPFFAELFRADVYKRTQGTIVRQVTCLALWVVLFLGCWSLKDSLIGVLGKGNGMLELAIPGVLFLAGMWVSYRAVNWPTFADFLIAVEAEMNKVSWPAKTELIRASIVVIFTIFFLAMSLFTFDAIWEYLFQLIGVSAR